jgi:hypothetical protein
VPCACRLMKAADSSSPAKKRWCFKGLLAITGDSGRYSALSRSVVKTSKRLPGESLCDAVKKSLDVALNPVNLRLIRGIKALSPAKVKAAQPVRNDSIIGWKVEFSGPGENISVTYRLLVVINSRKRFPTGSSALIGEPGNRRTAAGTSSAR